MNYFITKTQRSLMMVCVAILILQLLYSSVITTISPDLKPELPMIIFLKLFHILAFGYLMFMIFDYFRQLGLKWLQLTTLVMAITEITGIAITTYHNILDVTIATMPRLSQMILMTNSIAWNISIVAWIVLLFMAGSKAYPPIASLQKFGIGIVLLFVMGLLMPRFFQRDQFALGFRIINIAAALNYLFLLEFSMKIQQKERINDQRRKEEVGSGQ